MLVKLALYKVTTLIGWLDECLVHLYDEGIILILYIVEIYIGI